MKIFKINSLSTQKATTTGSVLYYVLIPKDDRSYGGGWNKP